MVFFKLSPPFFPYTITPLGIYKDWISSYWHLSRIYTSLDDSNSSQESLNKAKESINQQTMIISNYEDRDCFINKVYLHKRISGELAK